MKSFLLQSERRVVPLILAITTFLLRASVVTAADDLRIDEAWLRKYSQTAASWQVRCEGREEPLELQPEPVLTYSNPVRMYRQHGALYLWCDGGRPLFIGCVWSGADLASEGEYRYLSYEGHSLAEVPMQAAQAGTTLWTSDRPGVKWERVESMDPAGSRPLRLAQMRQLARAATVSMAADTADVRLLSQPLYRYPDETAGADDGAIFAWVMGTDPEAVAVIEAVDGEWKMAVARFTNEALTVSFGDGLSYDCQTITERTLSGPYWLNWDVERLPATLSRGQVIEAN